MQTKPEMKYRDARNMDRLRSMLCRLRWNPTLRQCWLLELDTDNVPGSPNESLKALHLFTVRLRHMHPDYWCIWQVTDSEKKGWIRGKQSFHCILYWGSNPPKFTNDVKFFYSRIWLRCARRYTPNGSQVQAKFKRLTQVRLYEYANQAWKWSHVEHQRAWGIRGRTALKQHLEPKYKGAPWLSHSTHQQEENG